MHYINLFSTPTKFFDGAFYEVSTYIYICLINEAISISVSISQAHLNQN